MFTPSLIDIRDLQLMIGSISIKYVANVSSVNKEARTTVFSAFLVILAIASTDPFISGKAGGLKFLFYLGSSFTAIHESKDCRGKGRVFF